MEQFTVREYIVREMDFPGVLKQEVVGEIVRCEECKHSEHWYKDKRRCFLWNEAGIDVFEDGFCSYGERREDG